MARIRVEAITIGDEILSGSIVDTNSSMIAEKLLGIGLEVWRMTSVGDDPREIIRVLCDASHRSQMAIVTGGLGPTEDDRTAQAAADAFDRPLCLHEPSLQRIRELFRHRGLEMTPNNERQAWIPKEAEVIPNPMGTAPGFCFQANDCLLVFLPGVPRELERMLEETVIPMAADRFAHHGCVLSRTLKVFGLSEAHLGYMLQGVLDDLDGVSLASLPRFPENRLRITVRAPEESQARKMLDQAESRLREPLGSSVYGVDSDELESVVVDLLREKEGSLAVAESCTGGLIAHRLTNVPGCSNVLKMGVVAYSLRAKEELLDVAGEILKKDGPVSERAVLAMARGVTERAGTAMGLASTGIAGPDGATADTPVGTVFLGLAHEGRAWSQRFCFRGGRQGVKMLASTVALDWLRRYLLGEDPEGYASPWR